MYDVRINRSAVSNLINISKYADCQSVSCGYGESNYGTTGDLLY